MGTRFTFIALCLVCLLAFSCSGRQKETTDPTVVKLEKFRQTYDSVTMPDIDDDMAFSRGFPAGEELTPLEPSEDRKSLTKAEEKRSLGPADAGVTGVVLSRAHKAIGTRYVFGGTRPDGFDCSGFVQWAFKGAGIKLPRTAAEQSRTGFRIRDKSKMRAGDIVAFRRRGGYHTGIYLGDGKFIHAPSRNKRVRVESMESEYFARNFVGARRVDTSERSIEVAIAAQKVDQQYSRSSGRARYGRDTDRRVSRRHSSVSGSRKGRVSRSERASRGRGVERSGTRSRSGGRTVARSSRAQSDTKAQAGRSRSKAQSGSRSSKKTTQKASRPARVEKKSGRNTSRAERGKSRSRKES